MDHSMQDNSERPAKRPCLSYTPAEEEEVSPDFDLSAARAQNDSRLKSLFEGIFAKYSQDFTDVGDEIDLATGDIVVDNGHLLGLQDENDPGDEPRPWLVQTGQDGSEDTDGDDGNDAKGEEFFSVTSSPRDESPPGPHESLLSNQQERKEDSSLDFVFTFKASGVTGLSSTAKEEHVSRSTNPVAVSKPQDPLWAVPELPQSFSTPKTTSRKTNTFLPNARSPSPPGSGSIWAARKPRRPRTDTKPKTTPNKRRPAAKRKYFSSPVTHDWSFAEIPDGNESDDPLQDYEPSPTPSRMKIIRGKRSVPTKNHDGPSTQRLRSPAKQPELAIEEGQGDYQDGAEKQSDQDGDFSGDHEETTPRPNTQSDAQLDSISQSNFTPQAIIEPQSPHPENTPSRRRPITPDEAKLIVCMMHKDGKKVSDVIQMLPDRDYQGVWHWFYYHWTRRLANPPPLSTAWSQPELTVLSHLSAQSGLMWAQIQHEFKGRTRNEVEFELLRAFVGEGFSCSTDFDAEVHVGEEKQQSRYTEAPSKQSIKEESEPKDFDEVFDDEKDGRSSEDTIQKGHEKVDLQADDLTDNKASIPNNLLGIFINSYT